MTQNINRGGARNGAGRPLGSKNKATVSREAIANETVVKLIAAGISNEGPLTPSGIAALNAIEVMQYAMIQQAVAGNWGAAADIAARVAPYRFARLTSTKVEATIHRKLEDFSDQELMALIGDEASEADDSDEAEDDE